MIDWLARHPISRPGGEASGGFPTVYVASTGRWATLRLLGGPTWGRMRRPSAEAYVLRDRRTLRLFAACDIVVDVLGLIGGRDVEIEVCKGETGRVTVRTDDDIGWNALDGPLPPDSHHCKTVMLAV